MSTPEKLLADSPADFDSSFAYALHPEMRRLLIAAIVGSLLLPIGLALFIDPRLYGGRATFLIWRVLGLGIGLLGAILFYGGVVGALFKIITDAYIVGSANSPEPEGG